MDSLTQFTLGAAVGEAVLGKKIGNKAFWIGGLFGTIPDLDIFFTLGGSVVDQLKIHRGISHSIFFAVLFGALSAYVLYKLFKKVDVGYTKWYLFAFLALFTHTILDCFTTYGTQLFEPFTNFRVGFNNIFVADFFYTIPLLGFLIAALFYKRDSRTRRILNWTGITISSLYILASFGMKYYTNGIFKQNLESQNIQYERYTTSPTPLNIFLWGITAETEDAYYLSHVSVFDTDKDNIEFTRLEKMPHLRKQFGSEKQYETLKWFSNDYFILTQNEDVVDYCDLRFGPMDYENIKRNSFPFYFKLKGNDKDLVVEEVREVPEFEEGFWNYWNRYWARVFGRYG